MIRYLFNYRKEKTRTGATVYRPVAYVYVKGARQEWFLLDLYIDSGADLSLLIKSDCELLGYSLEKGEERLIGGVSGSLIRTYVHKVTMRIGEIEMDVNTAFAELDDVPRLLGRQDIFNHFQICFDEFALKTEFIPRSLE